MNKLCALFIAVGVAGCAAPIDRRPYLNSLVGEQETEIVRRMGVPSRTYESGGHRFLAYQERQTSVYSSGPSFSFGGFGYGGGFGGLGYGFSSSQVVERVCETTLEVAGGQVVSWAQRGNACL